MTYSSVVEAMGGRDKAVEFTASAMKQLKQQGVSITKFEVGDPGEIYKEGGNLFVVVPTTAHMKAPGSTIVARGYELGISADSGKTWKFIGSSACRTKTQRTNCCQSCRPPSNCRWIPPLRSRKTK